MGLTMLLSRRIVKLKRSQSGTSHEQESDILNIFDVFLVGILGSRKSVFASEGSNLDVKTNIEDLEDVKIANH